MEELANFGQKMVNEMLVSKIYPYNVVKNTLYDFLQSYLKDGICLLLKSDIDSIYRTKTEYEMMTLGLEMLFPNLETPNNNKLASLLTNKESQIKDAREQMLPLLMLLGLDTI